MIHRHSNVSLVSKFELLSLPDLVNIRVFLRLAFSSVAITLSFRLFRRNLLHQDWEVLEQLCRLKLLNRVDWDIWHFVLKTPVDINTSIHLPTSMSEPLDRVEFVPL